MATLTAITQLIKLDSQHNDRTKLICNKHDNCISYTTQYYITIDTLQPNQV